MHSYRSQTSLDIKQFDEEIRIKAIGPYKWISIEEPHIILLEQWKDDIHFCPYKPSKGKWVLTCKAHLDTVSNTSKGQKQKQIL